MRLLDRYLLRELLIPLFYCFGGFSIFWISFDLINRLPDFQKLRLKVFEVAQYELVKMPNDLMLVLPISLLLALLYALANHSRHHELTAMRAAGIGFWRLCRPYLMLGLLLSVGLLAIGEFWVPLSDEAANEILNRHAAVATNAAAGKWEHKLGFTNTREQRKWMIEAYESDRGEMVRPLVDWLRPDGTRVVLDAERATWSEEGWLFTNVLQRIFPAERGALPMAFQTNSILVAEFSETPDSIKSEIKISRIDSLNVRAVTRAHLSIREILEYKRRHRDESSSKDTMLNTKLHSLLAAPWTCFVVVLIALPFGAGTARRNVYVGVASSVLICFAYYVLMNAALVLGTRGMAPPWLAAWAPNVLFAIGGALLTQRVA